MRGDIPPEAAAQAAPGIDAGPLSAQLELDLARLLTGGSYISVALLAVGLVAMVVQGVSPRASAPPMNPATLPADLLAGRPEAFLWLGIIAAIVTPTLRVVAALAGFVRLRERPMVAVALMTLGVITLSVVVARLAEA